VTLQPGSSFPNIPLQDQAGRRASLPGGTVLYGFFKTSCPTCELAWPYLDRVRQAGEGSDFSVWGVSQDDPEATENFSRRLGLSMPTLYDPNPWPASNRLGLTTVPTFLVVGPDGRIQDETTGFQRRKMEEWAELAARLAGRPAPKLFGPDEKVPAIKPG
jgi:peroxiredoxin